MVDADGIGGVQRAREAASARSASKLGPGNWRQDKNCRFILEEIACVVRAARGKLAKVILETALLNDIEKIAACAPQWLTRKSAGWLTRFAGKP